MYIAKIDEGERMDWETIKKKIKEECKAQGKSLEYTNKFIGYAQKLYQKNIPIISSPKHFSMLVGLDHNYVCRMAYGTEFFYRHFSIPKRNGKIREIYEPLPDLKFVQEWILENILEKCPVSEYAKAYVKGRTLKHNARFHKDQKILVTMDIKDFFPSISIDDVTKIFNNIGYLDDVSCFLAYLCCLNNQLPQGAPTSPYLSNLRLLELDKNISEYVTEHSIRYTRYADDLTFSGDFDPKFLIKNVWSLVKDSGFLINSQKTRVARQNARQEVTGIVVNKKMQVAKAKRKEIRKQIYFIKKFGLESHLEHVHETRANYLNHLLGQINFALFVNPNDKELQAYFKDIVQIQRRNSFED